MGTIKERKMVLNKMAKQTIVEFKHAKKYLESLCGRRERKQTEKKKPKIGRTDEHATLKCC